MLNQQFGGATVLRSFRMLLHGKHQSCTGHQQNPNTKPNFYRQLIDFEMHCPISTVLMLIRRLIVAKVLRELE